MNRTYTNSFEFFRVDDQVAMDEACRIRYRVYCEERGFLDPKAYPDGRESDEYDAFAENLLGRHRVRGTPACTARLVPQSDLGFPMAQHCLLDPEFRFLAEPRAAESEHFVEISRLAISKLYRQRAGDDPLWGGPPRKHPPDGGNGAEPGGTTSPDEAGSEIFAGIYKCIYHQSKYLGVTHWIVAMERSLYVMLRRIGHIYRPIGPTVDYYGPVTPYLAVIEDIEQALAVKRPSAFNYWMDGLEAEYRPRLEPGSGDNP